MNVNGEKASIFVKVDAGLKIEAQVKMLREGRTLATTIESLLEKWIEGEVKLPPEVSEGKEGPAKEQRDLAFA